MELDLSLQQPEFDQQPSFVPGLNTGELGKLLRTLQGNELDLHPTKRNVALLTWAGFPRGRIAKELNITRQAVSEHVRTAKEILFNRAWELGIKTRAEMEPFRPPNW